jgi:predicted nuclease of predicted toxin-antitoxin system
VRLLANENCPGALVVRLRQRGHDVAWIRDLSPGAGDERVLARAKAEGRVLLTFDKDFGELAVSAGISAPSGVVLLRVSAASPDSVAAVVADALEAHPGWEGAFSVIEDARIRRRQLS